MLIGRAGELPKETFDRAYKALKASNPIISDEIVRGGRTCIIPIRYPLTHMVADGYAAIGDAAFMTIPMIGSGIENSMKAACILADTIIKSNSVKRKTCGNTRLNISNFAAAITWGSTFSNAGCSVQHQKISIGSLKKALWTTLIWPQAQRANLSCSHQKTSSSKWREAGQDFRFCLQ